MQGRSSFRLSINNIFSRNRKSADTYMPNEAQAKELAELEKLESENRLRPDQKRRLEQLRQQKEESGEM